LSGLGCLLAFCGAIQAVALMAWFGALSLERVIAAACVLTSAPRTELLPRLLRQAGPIAILAGALWPWLQVGVVLDDPRALLDADQISQVLTQTSFGRIALAREALVIAAVLAAGLPAGFAPSSNRATYVLLAAALGSVALIGHAAGISGALGAIERTTLALHLLAAGAWLGALPLLWMLADRQGSAELAQTLERFSRFGAVLVALVLASGTLSAWYRLGAAQALFTSGYGRILLGKIALVGGMGAIALFNRNRLTPALKRPDLQDQLAARRALRWSIAVETAVGALVVAVAFVLGSAEAPQ
jgi:putative copper resistance protein D